MCRGEGGFSFVEGLLALSLVLIIAITLFPLCLKMLLRLDEMKTEMTASRLLYEYVEKSLAASFAQEEIEIGKEIYTLYGGYREGGAVFACVEKEEFSKCIEG